MTCLNVHGHKMVLQRAPSSPALQARASADRETAEMRLLHLGGGVDGRGSRHREEGGAVRRHADLVAFPKYGAAAASACRQPCSAGGAHTSEEELGSRHGKRAREGQEIRSWADTTMETSEEVPLQRSLVPRRCTGGGRRGADGDPALSRACGESDLGLFLSFGKNSFFVFGNLRRPAFLGRGSGGEGLMLSWQVHRVWCRGTRRIDQNIERP